MFEYFISNLIYKVICSNQPSSFFEIQVYCFQSRWVSILDRIVSFSLFKKTIHLDKMETRIPQNQGSFASTNEYSPYSERTTEIIELYFIYIYKINLFNILEGKRIWGKLIKSVPFKDKNSCCNCIDFYFELFLLRKKKKMCQMQEGQVTHDFVHSLNFQSNVHIRMAARRNPDKRNKPSPLPDKPYLAFSELADIYKLN